jgi:CRP-like cAMP-binding protein
MLEQKRLMRVLDADPELGELLDAASYREAQRQVVAELRSLAPGEWLPGRESDNGDGGGHLGFLILDGLLLRDVRLANSVCGELLGQGDLVRPWDEDVYYSAAPLSVSWRVLRATRLAVLDRRFAAIACRWPGLIEMTLRRTSRRSHSLAFHLALSNLKRVDLRLEVLFWYLSERWGRVGVDGVTVPLPLTHEMLAHLVTAKRPSVTTALGQLARHGSVSRRADGTWVLHGGPPAEFDLMPLAAARRAA